MSIFIEKKQIELIETLCKRIRISIKFYNSHLYQQEKILTRLKKDLEHLRLFLNNDQNQQQINQFFSEISDHINQLPLEIQKKLK